MSVVVLCHGTPRPTAGCAVWIVVLNSNVSGNAISLRMSSTYIMLSVRAVRDRGDFHKRYLGHVGRTKTHICAVPTISHETGCRNTHFECIPWRNARLVEHGSSTPYVWQHLAAFISEWLSATMPQECALCGAWQLFQLSVCENRIRER